MQICVISLVHALRPSETSRSFIASTSSALQNASPDCLWSIYSIWKDNRSNLLHNLCKREDVFHPAQRESELLLARSLNKDLGPQSVRQRPARGAAASTLPPPLPPPTRGLRGHRGRGLHPRCGSDGCPEALGGTARGSTGQYRAGRRRTAQDAAQQHRIAQDSTGKHRLVQDRAG